MNSEKKHFDINKIAKLAKLNLHHEEEGKFEKQMIEIISYFSSLSLAASADLIASGTSNQGALTISIEPLFYH